MSCENTRTHLTLSLRALRGSIDFKGWDGSNSMLWVIHLAHFFVFQHGVRVMAVVSASLSTVALPAYP